MAKATVQIVEPSNKPGIVVSDPSIVVIDPATHDGFNDATARIAKVPALDAPVDAMEPDGALASAINEAKTALNNASEALRATSREFIAEAVYRLSIVQHLLDKAETPGVRNREISALLASVTDESAVTKRVVLPGRDDGLRYDFTEVSQPMSRQLAQLYRKLSAWEAGIYGDNEQAPSSTRIVEWEPSLDSDAYRMWRENGSVRIRDKWGMGDYTRPVEALRAGRLFSAVYAAFQDVVRPQVENLGTIGPESEKTAFDAAEETKVTVRMRKVKESTSGGRQQWKSSKIVVKNKTLLAGHLRGIMHHAMRSGTLNFEDLTTVTNRALEHAKTVPVQIDETEE